MTFCAETANAPESGVEPASAESVVLPAPAAPVPPGVVVELVFAPVPPGVAVEPVVAPVPVVASPLAAA